MSNTGLLQTLRICQIKTMVALAEGANQKWYFSGKNR